MSSNRSPRRAALSTKNATSKCKCIGRVHASDPAAIDKIIDQRHDGHSLDYSDFRLQNKRRSSRKQGELCIMNDHQLLYRDQLIFDLSTIRVCDGVEIWGQKSTCTIRGGCLKIKFSDNFTDAHHLVKQNDLRNRKKFDSFVIPLDDLVKRSALARQTEMLFADGSPVNVAEF